MPTTTDHKIYYPSGTAVPNIPVQSQTTAESVEAALNKVTKAPMVITTKNNQNTSATIFAVTNVTWNENTLLQGGMKHTVGSANITVPETAIYRLDCRLTFVLPDSMGRLLVYINGVRQEAFETELPAGPNYYAKPSVAASFKMDAGDTLVIGAASSKASVQILGLQSYLQLSKVVSL